MEDEVVHTHLLPVKHQQLGWSRIKMRKKLTKIFRQSKLTFTFFSVELVCTQLAKK